MAAPRRLRGTVLRIPHLNLLLPPGSPSSPFRAPGSGRCFRGGCRRSRRSGRFFDQSGPHRLRGIALRHRTVPARRSPEVYEAVAFEVVRVEGDLVPLVERSDGPDDRLGLVGVDWLVEVV